MVRLRRRPVVDASPPVPRRALVLPLVLTALTAGCIGEQSTGTPPPDDGLVYQDHDEDTIMDVHEGPADTDGDGVLDYRDTDSDEDGIPDSIEAGDVDPLSFPVDSDGDGLADFRDPDSDDNGIPDLLEAGANPLAPLDLDRDGDPDFRDADNDGDSIGDAIEIGPAVPLDTDGDGLSDYLDSDSDADTILDAEEARVDPRGLPRDTDQDGLPDFRDPDADGDGFRDQDEAGDKLLTTAPRDTDEDGTPDFIDLDSDGDAVADSAEGEAGTDAYVHDSDGDGYSDGGELAAGSLPTDALSVPQGLYLVVPQRSRLEADFQFTAHIGRADVIFVLDTTGSMGPTLSALASNFTTVVAEVSSRIPDAAFGVVTFKDYNAPGMGGGGDRPFRLDQQVTRDLAKVQTVLRGLNDGGGGDLPETALEALYQAAAGVGFDQGCDGNFDANYDVAPFLASIQDVFHGSVAGVYDPADSSTGLIGGAGIRRYALPIFVWTTDTDFRDPDDGDPAAGSCGNAAGENAVVKAMEAIGGKLIGVNSGDEQTVTDQMKKLAQETYSIADLDADGDLEPLVFNSKGGPDIVDAVAQGVTAMHASGEFQEVELRVDGDTWGFVSDIQPPSYSRVSPGQTIDFSLTLFGASPAADDDQIFLLNLVVVGDGATSLDARQILVVVPGAG